MCTQNRTCLFYFYFVDLFCLRVGGRNMAQDKKEKKRVAHPSHSNMRGADVRTRASSSSRSEKTVDLNKSQLMLLRSRAPPSPALLLLAFSFAHLPAVSDLWPAAHTFSSHPALFVLPVCVADPPEEQVRYKSVAALASPALWFPFVSMSCNQSLVQSPPCVLPRSLFSCWSCLQNCQCIKDWRNIECYTNSAPWIRISSPQRPLQCIVRFLKFQINYIRVLWREQDDFLPVLSSVKAL